MEWSVAAAADGEVGAEVVVVASDAAVIAWSLVALDADDPADASVAVVVVIVAARMWLCALVDGTAVPAVASARSTRSASRLVHMVCCCVDVLLLCVAVVLRWMEQTDRQSGRGRARWWCWRDDRGSRSSSRGCARADGQLSSDSDVVCGVCGAWRGAT